MANAANRKAVINDIDVTSLCTWTTYINDTIDFTKPNHYIGFDSLNTKYLKGRIAQVFLDYTYRNLSIEANRRLFVTEDGKPASGQVSLNPIMYCPMKSPEDWYKNLGTGGNFTPNGIVALSQLGPNQDNCVASVFDGSADYLSSTNIGALDSTQITLVGQFTRVAGKITEFININASGDRRFSATFYDGNFTIIGEDSSSIVQLRMELACDIPVGFHGLCAIVIDMSSQSLCKIFLNNEELTGINFVTFIQDGVIDLTVNSYRIQRNATTGYGQGTLGELYADNSYESDLSIFWDEDNNRPKPVRQVLAETGNTPLIAMPIRADKPGLNLTGPDFTEVSAPFTGARGMSEFWARSAKFNGSTGYLESTNTLSDKKITFTTSVPHQLLASDVYILSSALIGGSNWSYFGLTDAERLKIELYDFTGTTQIFSYESNKQFNTVGTSIVLVSIDIDVASAYIEIDGVQDTGIINTFSANLNAYFPGITIGRLGGSSGYFPGSLGFITFSNEIVDFSEEAVRLKYIDALGYPIDLQKQIDNNVIPTPLIYMPFDDPDNLGYNPGTGGNFTINGTITQGSDVDPN
jgi:hypothetical protein